MYDLKFILEDLNSGRKKKVILDSDTYNEIDDQFALAYLMNVPEKAEILGVCAAPYFNARSTSYEDGMEKSYDEIGNIINLVDPNSTIPRFKGSRRQMPDTKTPIESDAANFIIKCAKEIEGEPLYILGIGASTNIASALLLAPEIKDKIVVVWLGGNAVEVGSNAGEFNMDQDIYAINSILEADVAFVQYPAEQVTSACVIHSHEMEKNLKESGNAICSYLYNFWMEFKKGYRKATNTCDTDWYGRVIWDIAGTACFALPGASEFEVMKKPVINIEDYKYDFSNSKYDMIMVKKLDSRAIVADMFKHIC